ncbi:hypothetical protein BC829DRAFT_386850 [Chytridium lagenaria]|nr:hypothetical protein BC829DRAFT_386850 [Chytridium lagenaria]
MEAESQCAWLLNANLVVYKNVFNQNKYVESYTLERLEGTMGLQRRWLVLLAYLLGSDYTEGVPSVGIVSAMEILREFSGVGRGIEEEEVGYNDLKCLEEFKMWVRDVQMGEKDGVKSAFRQKFRKRAKGIELPNHFPDPRNREFTWGSPDLNEIRDFMEEKAGLSPSKTDDVLIPVIREMDKQRSGPKQLLLDRFFQKNSTSVHHSSRVSVRFFTIHCASLMGF